VKARSTLNGNSAGNGGGIWNSGGMLTLTSCAVSGNSGTGAAAGGGIFNNGGTLTSRNTMLAGNSAPTSPDVNGAVVGSSDYNLMGDGSGMTGISNGVNGNQVGSAPNPIGPMLGQLQATAARPKPWPSCPAARP
jgi:hypothetical protein